MAQGTSVEEIQAIKLPPSKPLLDFNDELLTVGAHVLFARMRGVLAEGIVVAVDDPPGSVTIKSLVADRYITVDAEGAIKTRE